MKDYKDTLLMPKTEFKMRVIWLRMKFYKEKNGMRWIYII